DDAGGLRAVYQRLAEVHAAHAGIDLDELEASPLSDDVAAGVAALADLVERAARDREVWEIGSTTLGHVADLTAWAVDRGAALSALGPSTLLHGDFQRGNWLLED